jgi:MOSC domain-containing protein YiiM
VLRRIDLYRKPVMKLISVNLGQERTVPKGRTTETTGIYKTGVVDLVAVTRLGLAGDSVCDPKHHGGPDQAVYVYGAPDYAWWSRELGKELAPGTFGDNLTIDGLESARAAIGDRLTVGTVVLEVSAPRIPCGTLARRMGDPQFVKRYRDAESPGLYCRVLQEGSLRAGDAVGYISAPAGSVPVLDLFREYYTADPDEATVRRILASPLAERARHDEEKRLEKLTGKKI